MLPVGLLTNTDMADREYRTPQLAPCLPDRQAVNLGWQRKKYREGYIWQVAKQQWEVSVYREVRILGRVLTRSSIESPEAVTCCRYIHTEPHIWRLQRKALFGGRFQDEQAARQAAIDIYNRTFPEAPCATVRAALPVPAAPEVHDLSDSSEFCSAVSKAASVPSRLSIQRTCPALPRLRDAALPVSQPASQQQAQHASLQPPVTAGSSASLPPVQPAAIPTPGELLVIHRTQQV